MIGTSSTKTRVLTGIKPTGDLQVGNYAGGLKPIIDASRAGDSEVIMMCADWHGLTNRKEILEPGAKSYGVVAAALALGFELEGNSIILQSDFPQILEIAWYLACASQVGMLERAHAYKDAIANGKEPTNGLFYYPVLMAADIITFDTHVVPVGKDQSQHIEYASDMAKLFNNAVGKNVLREPHVRISADIPLVIGIDGERKMSKSYKNTIDLFMTKKDLEKRVKEIKTDSRGLNDEKDPNTCAVYQIMRAFGRPEALNDMAEKLRRGTGYGYGHAKMDFVAEYEHVFGAKRELYEYYLNNPAEMKKLLAPGMERATAYANRVCERVREAAGLKSFR